MHYTNMEVDLTKHFPYTHPTYLVFMTRTLTVVTRMTKVWVMRLTSVSLITKKCLSLNLRFPHTREKLTQKQQKKLHRKG